MSNKYNILIVEDERSQREKLGDYFKKKFANVCLASTGLEGLNKFIEYYEKDEMFDLILTDIVMPELDGLEMLEKIREIDKKVPTILVTAHHDKLKIIKAIDLQISGYFFKPLNIEDLEDKIDTIFNKKNSFNYSSFG
jgi:YesN/AraC family two-component response regulator